MKVQLILLASFLFLTSLFGQPVDFESAKTLSKASNQPILMIFSGSDWCKPCIHLKNQVINDGAFKRFAETNLVLLEVDFPYRKANRLSKEKQLANDKLAEVYNREGEFPKVVLMDSNGELIGMVKSRSLNAFIQEIKKLIFSHLLNQ